MKDIWPSWHELDAAIQGKKVILWGRSEDWVPSVISKIECSYIIDSNPAYQDEYFYGIPIFLPEKLAKEAADDIFIIITGHVFQNISEDLDQLGLVGSRHYCCSPEMRDWALLGEIKSHQANLVITSADYEKQSTKRYSQAGGGVYLFNSLDESLEKKCPGHFRQIIRVDDVFYAVEYVEKKVYVLDAQLKLVDKIDIDQSLSQDQPPNACGIAYHRGSDKFFIANAGSDHIDVFERNNFLLVDEIQISDEFRKYKSGQHHINDLCIADEYLLVSCFSISGNWKRGILDGGVFSYDVNSLKDSPKVIARDLWMPHSVEYIDRSICFLDSMNGDFWVGNKRIEGNFPGYVRGLAYDGRFYYIGQSESMYSSRLFGFSKNVMCNAGLYLFDKDTKVSRFFSFPKLMNIHDVVLL